MPRYYMHFQNGDLLAKDDVGQDLLGVEEAQAIATASARDILADNVKHDAKNPLRAVIIANERGETVLTIPAKDVLRGPVK